MNKLHITPRVGWSILAVFALFLANHYGFAATHNEMMVGGLALAGIGDIEDVTTLLKEQGSAFEEFIKKNDERYNALDKEFSEFAKKANRPKMGSGYSDSSREMTESKTDLANLIRSRGESKGMFSGSGPDGGWTVAPVLQEGIGSIVRNNSALRTLVTFTEIGAGDSFEELISTSAVGAAWVGEKQARSETASPKLVRSVTALNEMYACPILTQKLADDSGTAMIEWLVNETALSFAESEEDAFFNGDGINKPKGLAKIATAATADATRPFWTLQHVPTGVSGDWHATNPLDAVKALFFAVKAGYRANAKWVCSSEVALQLSQFKDGAGRYFWSDGNVNAGQPTTFLGKEIVICETCPPIAANSLSLWFGDWGQALRAIERPGNKVLVDPFSSKPELQVYVYRRMGLQLRDSNAVKCLKFAAA